MQLAGYIFILFIGGFTAAILSLLSIKIDSLIRPERTAVMVEMAALAYSLIAVWSFLWGLIVSLIVLISRSLTFSLIVAIAFSLWTSWEIINRATDIYKRTDYFDKEFFQADIVQICANFIIFPLTCFAVWRQRDRYSI